jgi:pimeloyl-ACP methyl ester carboxylesterase
MHQRTAPLIAAVLLVVACSDADVVRPEPASLAQHVAAPLVIPGVDVDEGVLGPGALYQILTPANWNGTLVLYAHGYFDADSPLRLPDPSDPLDAEGQVIAALVGLGYATAFSSFSENGLAVKDGAQRTRQLRGIFVSKVARPARTLLVGASLGGTIAVKLVEDQPGHYDGALALCGFVGGTRVETDYFGHLRVLFDVFYPGVIPGDLFTLPAPATRPFYLAAAATALTTDPAGAAAMQAIMTGLGTPIPGGADPTLVGQAIVTAIQFNFTRFDDILARTRGKVFFDNVDTDYGDPGLNAVVDRFEVSPSAANYLAKYYQPDGDLAVPVVTLHTAYDPVAPAFHEAIYAGIVAAAGRSGMLTQTMTPGLGHCTFQPSEVLTAFGTLDLLSR